MDDSKKTVSSRHTWTNELAETDWKHNTHTGSSYIGSQKLEMYSKNPSYNQDAFGNGYPLLKENSDFSNGVQLGLLMKFQSK